MKIYRFLFLILLCTTAVEGFAQVYKPYREAYMQAMYVDSSHYYGHELDSTPFIGSNNILQLYTGEQVFLEATINNKQLSTIRSIEPDSLVKPAFVVDVSQQANGTLHTSVTLSITNNLKKGVWVMVSAYEVEKSDWTEDKLMFIEKGKTATMVWKEFMVSVLVSEWKFK